MYFGDPYVDVVSVRDPMPGYDKSPPWSTQFTQSLEGNFTMWMPQTRPQARKPVWPWMSTSEANLISSGIRSTYSPGPVAFYDPETLNLLFPQQARGRGSTRNFSTSAVGGTITNATSTTAEGPLNRRVQVGALTVGAKVYWNHPAWSGFPMCVTTTQDKSFYFVWSGGGFSLGTGGLIGVEAINTSGSVVETITASATGSGGTVSGSVVSSSYRFLRPFIQLGPAVSLTGPSDIGNSALRLGTSSAPFSVLAEGEGCPAYGVQSFSDVVNMWPYRSISASLVEVIASDQA